jgi:hypothetical protein
VLDLKSGSFERESVDASCEISNPDPHGHAAREQDLAEHNALISIKFGDHERVFLTNWIEPSNL